MLRRIGQYGILLLFMILLSLSMDAQSFSNFKPNDIVKITLLKGTKIVGKVLSIDESSLLVLSKTLGEVNIRREDLASITATSQVTISDMILPEDNNFDNPIANKNFLTETAYTIKTGEVTYQNLMLGVSYITVGITDNFNVVFGTELFNLFEGSGPSFQISSKYSMGNPEGNVRFAIGGNLFLLQEGFTYGLGGSVFGVITFGNHDHNLTTGLGLAYYDGANPRYPVLQLGGMTRISNRIFLVADNILISDRYDSLVLGTVTARFAWERLSIDIGVGTDYNYGAIPVLGGSYNF